ncbi:hypothetical protein [Leptospirillum ferriphilum]|uniref:Uncharacterized protein n=1 Tax=Leptospirillum ferriphilum TaxID=178606 RepID=A0A1V3SSB7_9BACT|nr:hypothetical protein [Leptospirillum ferriphilum]OOH70033.1 hypothetical protein BOX24_11005 [Leptospirillum ferriphilum]OOH82400.1 hypothetical protein BOX30_02750 [Leptospirillum ferriphilum]
MRKTLQKAVGLLASGLLALGAPAVSMADNLSPDTPYSHQGNTANNQSGTPAPAPAANSVPTDPDSYNSEFHNSFQNLMPDAPPPGYTSMLGKWTTMMYGFVEFDTMYDSSNSFNNWPFNGGAANAGTIQNPNNSKVSAGNDALGKTINSSSYGFDVNNSRIGFALSSPVYHGYKLRALLEMDFLADPGESQYAVAGGENTGYFTNPIFRIRHFFMDITTPGYGNFLLGQYWSLFGWQPYNIYNSVQIAPAPGTLYGRFPQARWYKIIHATDGLKVEPAISAMMPQYNASGMPAFVEGIKIADSDWMGEGMIGDTGKGQFPMSLGFSAIQSDYDGYFQQTNVNKTTNASSTFNSGFNSWTSAEAVDLWLPILPVRNGKPGNNLTLTAEYSWGQGDAYQFPNMNFGIGPNNFVSNCPPNTTCSSPLSPGLPAGEGFANGNAFVPLDIQTYNVNLQYYFPDDAHTSISLGFAVDNSSNLQSIADAVGATTLGGAGSTNGLYKYLAPWTRNTFTFVNIWHDFTPAVRAGLEYGQYDTLYTTGISALDNRVMMSWFYFF